MPWCGPPGDERTADERRGSARRAAGAGAAYASYVVASKQLIAERSRHTVLPVVFGLAGLLLAALALVSRPPTRFQQAEQRSHPPAANL